MEEINRHFLQFIDQAQCVHELQVPAIFDGAHTAGVVQFGGKYVLIYQLPDGTTPMLAMPDEYAPEKGWQFGGYRRE
jgi:hypothetical protein